MKIITDFNILGGSKDFNLNLHLIEKSVGIIAANSYEHISSNSLLQLFWNASSNNDLIHYLNQQSYFPALFRRI